MLKIYLKLLQKYRPSAGWTLAELIIASAMTLIVVMVAGFSLVTILRENKVANATGQMQYDMNRATEFISEEIRGAKTIETDQAVIYNAAPTFYKKYVEGKANPKIPILALKIDGVYERVVYYVDEVADGEIWQGPGVIRRFGPAFTATGEHDDAQKRTPDTWQSSALVDMMVTTLDTPQKQCQNLPPDVVSANTYVATDDQGNQWYRLPQKEADVKGFFVCVQENKQLVQLNIVGTSLDEFAHLGYDKNDISEGKSRYADKMEYNIATMVHARSEAIGGGGEAVPDFLVSQQIIKLQESGKAKLNVLHANIPCQGDPSNTSQDVETSFDKSGSSVGTATGELSGSVVDFTVPDGDPPVDVLTQIKETSNCTDPSVKYEIEVNQTQKVKFTTNDNSAYPTLNSLIDNDLSAYTDIVNKLKAKNLIKAASDGSTYYFSLADNQVLYFVELETEGLYGSPPTYQEQADPPKFDDVIILVELTK
ncbi:hypothetical protein cce_3650 [Crocosphaera subtropica ATCC 51142]|uniref:Prepilin-type N-terminal cleavage/methylation domain-containing protein n=1 Tax=Crocosphaera subtropica (strain ATCC 51142 / BH68) TaxID=43989 RepID=B1X0V9_CROS5|nr:hypothetical protein [Crocosphaera subtropica]ACB52998.1 hypothetical protein cce_3650 [Crocosphaera subtropica ATCC 51142]